MTEEPGLMLAPSDDAATRSATSVIPSPRRANRTPGTPTTGEPAPTGRGLPWLVGAVEYAFIAVGYVLLFTTHLVITSDGRHRYNALDQLLSGHGLSADRYQLVGPLFATPLWVLGRMRFTGRDTFAWLVHYNLLLFGLSLVALFFVLRKRVAPVVLRRFLLLLVAGTMIATHTTNFYGELFTAATVAVGVFAVACVGLPRIVRAVAWIAVILGTANTPACVPALGLVGGELAVRRRRLRYLLPMVAAAGIILLENWLRRGDPLDQGYAGEQFNYPFVLGALAILFSFGKGLVFFVPGLMLPIRRKAAPLYDPKRIDLPQAYRSGMLYVAGLVLVYSSWWAWNGDTSWGPRFFLIAIFPASLALAVWLARADDRVLPNLALLAILGVSVWIGANSMTFNDMWPPHCYQDMEYCRFDITDSRLWYPLRAWPDHLGLRAAIQLGYHAVVFAWLAVPVAGNLLRAAVRRGRLHVHLLRPVSWRF